MLILLTVALFKNTLNKMCLKNFDYFLAAELALHIIDLVIADNFVLPDMNINGNNHQLIECGVSNLPHLQSLQS